MKFFKFILIIILPFFILQKNLIANDNSILANKISKNLRCLICQGQSIYDSQSDFAVSVKLFIRKIIIILNVNMLINLIYQYFLQLIIHFNHQLHF